MARALRLVRAPSSLSRANCGLVSLAVSAGGLHSFLVSPADPVGVGIGLVRFTFTMRRPSDPGAPAGVTGLGSIASEDSDAVPGTAWELDLAVPRFAGGGVGSERPLVFHGPGNLRDILVLATLLGRSVEVRGVREAVSGAPGIRDEELIFVRLLDQVTDGGRLEINDVGTRLRYVPGTLVGGTVEHDCTCGRGLGYFLEPLLFLGPWGRLPLNVTLHGLTNTPWDPSVDAIRTVLLPILQLFSPALAAPDALSLRILRRAVASGQGVLRGPPVGGGGSGSLGQGRGTVALTCPVVRDELSNLVWLRPGRIEQVRGVAYSVALRHDRTLATRMVSAANTLLQPVCANISIAIDQSAPPPPPDSTYSDRSLAQSRDHGTLPQEALNPAETGSIHASSGSRLGGGGGGRVPPDTVPRHTRTGRHLTGHGIVLVAISASRHDERRRMDEVSRGHAARAVWAATGGATQCARPLSTSQVLAQSTSGAAGAKFQLGELQRFLEEPTLARISAQAVLVPGTRAEATGALAARRLLWELAQGGVVDSTFQAVPLVYAVFGPPELTQLRLGATLTPRTVGLLRLIHTFLGIKFTFVPDPATQSIVVSAVGIGYRNMFRRMQ